MYKHDNISKNIETENDMYPLVLPDIVLDCDILDHHHDYSPRMCQTYKASIMPAEAPYTNIDWLR